MTKVISLSEEAYKALKRLKRRGESFSDVVIKVTRNVEPGSLLELAGGWAGGDIDEVFRKISQERETAAARELRI
jgi:predicted CopG family antitoxin